jgi:hypothetical protein
MSSIESELLTGASLASPQASRRRFVWEATGVPLELPGAQIELLLRWLKPNQARRRWSTLLAEAGSKDLETAMKLADWLLRHGWSMQYEKRSGSRWNITWLEFPRLDALREMFQLPDPRQLASDWASASAYRFDAADLAAAHSALASLPLARRLQRFSLLKSSASGAMKKDKAPAAIFPCSPVATAKASAPPNGTGSLLRSTSKKAASSSTRRTCWSPGRSACIPAAASSI